MHPDDTPLVDGGLGPAVTSSQVVGAKESPVMVRRKWNGGSGRVAGLINLSRRSLQPRSLLQKRGHFICTGQASLKCNLHNPKSELIADHGLDIGVGRESCFSFEDIPLCVDIK